VVETEEIIPVGDQVRCRSAIFSTGTQEPQFPQRQYMGAQASCGAPGKFCAGLTAFWRDRRDAMYAIAPDLGAKVEAHPNLGAPTAPMAHQELNWEETCRAQVSAEPESPCG
jgi:hypothetical protein